MTVITLSTASVYYAQKVKDSTKSVKDIEQVVLVGRNLTSVAKERKTPVAISSIKATEIQEKLGNREFPEIAKSTPSVYVTKVGGGYGDGRINIRGFDAVNIAVLINGQPVNDMENGSVFWSNWTGLADIASSIQIQRGLGASKLVVPSVGGTFNVVTKATDAKQGGLIKADVANNNYFKLTAAYSTGLSKNGWGTTVLLSRWQGDGWVNGTAGEGYSYFLSTGYRPNEKHSFNFLITGAPQIHDTRRASATGTSGVTLAMLDNYGSQYNPQTGKLNGAFFNVSPNFYHKPIASFNWDWNITNSLKLSTVVYASWGRGGGGAGLYGSIKNTAGKTMNYVNSADGMINWDMISAYNSGQKVTDYSGQVFQKTGFVAPSGASTSYNGQNIVNLSGTDGIVRKQGVNSHNWYGAIADLSYKINNWSFNGGVDLRTYKGLHYDIITDFLGSSGVFVKNGINKVTADVNNPNGYFVTQSVKPEPLTKLNDNQKVTYDYDGLVKWGGLYGQIEYSNEKVSAFFQGAVSRQSYKRVDRFTYTPGNQDSGWNSKNGYTLKTGINYNIDSHHNVFANTGLISRQPTFASIYPNNKNVYFNANNEKIFSVELGYGFKSKYLDLNLNAYRTEWNDRFITRNFNATASDVTNFPQLVLGNSYAYNAIGLSQLHQGIELEAKARPTSFIKLRGMLSLGNWKYKGNADYAVIDNTNLQVVNGATGTIRVDGLKVGDAAQTTAGAGVDVNITKSFSVDGSWEYYDKLYAQFNPTNFLTQAARDAGVVKIPHYHLFDAGVTYKFFFVDKKELVLRANVFNIFNTKYISELTSNLLPTSTSNNFNGVNMANNGFFGFGRTWAASATFRF